MRPSAFHNNKGYHNWLVYKMLDNFLEKYSKYYKRILVDLECRKPSFLDLLDKHKELETAGYMVLAQKVKNVIKN